MSYCSSTCGQTGKDQSLDTTASDELVDWTWHIFHQPEYMQWSNYAYTLDIAKWPSALLHRIMVFDMSAIDHNYYKFWHMQLYMSWYIRSFFGFTFFNILYFFKYSCASIFHRRSLYTFYIGWNQPDRVVLSMCTVLMYIRQPKI